MICGRCGEPWLNTDDGLTEFHRCPDGKEFNKPMNRTTVRDPLLAEREKTHGNFIDNAKVSQALKSVFRDNGYSVLDKVHAEALDMIALKISRVLSGQSMFKDHWDDIAGYAKLGSEACQKSQS